MNVIYTKTITKDVRKIKDKKLVDKLTAIIQQLKTTSSLEEVQQLKKLKGHPAAYRIRVGDYRLGFYYEENTVILARIVKRSDIYKLFP
ncbi:MAG TPA: type II toxin-antitoxin system RelE/ParE family toxin [Vicingaceae bacterium]|nr:type II toxin-antitoxin system RelE/ParE family toxin [Vicingaceae bacterium]